MAGGPRRSPLASGEHRLEARWGLPGGRPPPGVQAPSRERWSRSTCRSPSSERTGVGGRGGGTEDADPPSKQLGGGAGRERNRDEGDGAVTAGGRVLGTHEVTYGSPGTRWRGGASSRHWGEGTPRAIGSTRDAGPPGTPGRPRGRRQPAAGSLGRAARLARRGRVFWTSGTDARFTHIGFA